MSLIRYVGHLYRVAQEEDTLDQLREFAQQALSAYDVKGEEKDHYAEADGLDLVYDVSTKWPSLKALLTLDFLVGEEKPLLREVILDLCGVGYVGSDQESMGVLLETLGALQAVDYHPQEPTEDKAGKSELERLEYLKYYVGELVRGGATLADGEIRFDNKDTFAEDVLKLGTQGRYDARRAKQLSAIAMDLSDADWAKHIMPIVNQPGRRYTPAKKAVEDVIYQITRHEGYTGEVQILDYEGNEVIAAIGAAPPAEALVFVVAVAPGGKGKLVDMGLQLCSGTFATGGDVEKSKKLVTAMVDLADLSENAANPEFSKPPPEPKEQQEWSAQNLQKRMNAGMVIWLTRGGQARIRTPTGMGSCVVDDVVFQQWREPESSLRLMIQQQNIKDVFRVDPNGTVHLLDRATGEVIDKAIHKIPFDKLVQC